MVTAHEEKKRACHFCKKDLPDDDDWCYGCEHYICEECDKNDEFTGKHSVDAHLEPADG